MITEIANILKRKLKRGRRPKGRFKRISWLLEKIIKHQDDTKSKSVILGDLTIYYKRPYELLHSYREIFENEIYAFQSDKSTPLIIDCGSNIGLSVLYFKKIYPDSRIIGFEPDEGNYALLKKNLEVNHLAGVDIKRSAVWIDNNNISFTKAETEASHISSDSTGALVKAERLNDLLESLNEVDFLKMDIEGAEWQVVHDCASNLRKVKTFFLEYHGKVNETDKLTSLLQIVRESGFNVYIRNAADNLSYPFVEKTTNTLYDVQLNIFCYR
ncbi:MAG TPA: FkbM family methyltransferase [Flavisolibacter sp.]|nr:FkbM family methyltransferase [Flavisolibacter sp.]